MKKNLLLTGFLLWLSFYSFGQNAKWDVTVSSGATLGGPSASIKSKLDNAGWSDRQDNMVIFLAWSTDYPLKRQDPPLLLSFAKQIKEHKAFFLTAGLSDHGSVEGFKKEGVSSIIIVATSYGRYRKVDYKVWQLTAGYRYSFTETKIRLGFGPSLLLMTSKKTIDAISAQQETSVVPGATGDLRLPLGKGRKAIGFEFFAQANLALPVKVDDFRKEKGSTEKTSLNMIDLKTGLSLAFRKK